MTIPVLEYNLTLENRNPFDTKRQKDYKMNVAFFSVKY